MQYWNVDLPFKDFSFILQIKWHTNKWTLLTCNISFFSPLSDVIPSGTFKALTKASAKGVRMGNKRVFGAFWNQWSHLNKFHEIIAQNRMFNYNCLIQMFNFIFQFRKSTIENMIIYSTLVILWTKSTVWYV